MKHNWNSLYNHVLDEGKIISPRGRPTLECLDVTYSMDQYTHFDARPARDISLNYIAREFLWFCRADRFDVRMQDYAPIWKTCIQPDGGINSNYGQYLFGNGFHSPFFCALDRLAADPNTRRAWIPIFQSWHQTHEEHGDYPCTTGIGFRIRDDELQMTVHMRSQDMWWGAANDEPICYLLQLLAKAYLNLLGMPVAIGDIVHKIDSLHFYEKHWRQAGEAAIDYGVRRDVMTMTYLCQTGFNEVDIDYLLFGQRSDYISPLLSKLLEIPGAYGNMDGMI